ncbi:hypothetical protein [Thetidibacter halocola]|uniref:Peptidoglycan-binding protein n=1 Tax=Thetidibacter halocola TaxID=2827239 RepID=A0A8J8B7H6_9RHOB|nr:hypothetical protein [Thetidibacter halocola]MBS0123555.1 hypothetical protein [Thetidibacter halocola]
MRKAALALLIALPAAVTAQDGPLLLPVELPPPPATALAPDVQAVVFAQVPPARRAVMPLTSGLPQPSVLVGLIEGVNEPGQVLSKPDDPVPIIAWDDREARRAVRDQNPDLFASLLEAGVFDPPDARLAFALQEELQLMGCYSLRIDGQWGNGSVSAARRYFDELGQDPVTLTADMALFRQIVQRDDIRCPAPVAAPARVTQPARTNSTRSTPPRQTTATRTPAPTPAPAPQPAPRTGLSLTFGGVGIGVSR